MQSRTILTVGLAALALALSAAVAARDLTVVSWGGAYQDAQREVYFKPFMEKTGNKLAEENWDGGVGTLRAKNPRRKNVPWLPRSTPFREML